MWAGLVIGLVTGWVGTCKPVGVWDGLVTGWVGGYM